MTEETADKTTLFAQVRQDQHEALREMAFNEHVSMAALVRKALDLLITEKKEEKALEKALKDMGRIASEAIQIASDCHGGHSYTSIRSDEAKKCCEVRMQVDELKKRYLDEGHAQDENRKVR